MAHLFTFNSGRFRTGDERPNPINPIAGESVLKWLATQLTDRGFEVGAPDPEDWGWCTRVVSGPARYLLGACGEWFPTSADPRTDWTVLLELSRSLGQRLSGAHQMRTDDALSAAIEAVLRGDAEFRAVAVDRGSARTDREPGA